MPNTYIAFPSPGTPSTGDPVAMKNKIMSEEMIVKVIRALSPTARFIVSTYNSGAYREVILDGYYFYLQDGVMSPTTTDSVRFFTKTNMETSQTSFSELYWDDNYECLFTDGRSTPSGYTAHILTASQVNGLETINQSSRPYYIASNYDNNQRSRIWVKKSGDTILGAYVYDDDTSTWVPLGAVYKPIA